MKFSSILEAQVVRMLSVHMLSFIATVTPANLPTFSPLLIFLSISLAFSLASLKVGVIKAFIFPSTLRILSMIDSTWSSAVIS